MIYIRMNFLWFLYNYQSIYSICYLAYNILIHNHYIHLYLYNFYIQFGIDNIYKNLNNIHLYTFRIYMNQRP